MSAPHRFSEIVHHYGEHVHVLDDPFLTTQLAKLCQAETRQPAFNGIVSMLYTSLIRTVINAEFPRRRVAVRTRMAATTDRGTWEGEVVDTSTPTVVVDIARAGILPSQICYDTLNHSLDPEVVRQDHLIVARTTGKQHEVTGAAISGSKIGGTIEGCMLLFPDPMGATGTSLATAIESYLEAGIGRPSRLITLNLIITPEFVRRLTSAWPDVRIYALRLDRGMSTPEVLASTPGSRWSDESGLDSRGYIVPGGGGFGELMNNSWV